MKPEYKKQIARLKALPDEEFRETISKEWIDAKGIFSAIKGSYNCPVCICAVEVHGCNEKLVKEEIKRKYKFFPNHGTKIRKSDLTKFAYIQEFAEGL
jgi:hypothetical protein